MNGFRVVKTHHVRFVEDDDVGELDLVDHEIRDGALILGHDIVSPRGEKLIRVEVVVDCEGVNDSDASIEFGELFNAASRRSKEVSIVFSRIEVHLHPLKSFGGIFIQALSFLKHHSHRVG
jgi:hypothetical protein